MQENTIIRLTESELQKIILEGVRTILTEDQESKSVSAAKKLLRQHGYSESQADRIVRHDLPHDIPAFGIPKCRKFTLGVIRMLVSLQITNADIIAGLDVSVRMASSDELIDKIDRNLNGWSATEFISKMKPYYDEMSKREREGLSNVAFEGSSDYRIVPINSFEEAKKYAKYNDWCITTRKDMFEQYTSQGTNQMYFCLRNEFENEEMEVGEGCPLDAYGLSMICVIVSPEGNLVFCTCRWNHEHGGNDQIMGAKQLSEVLNVNFFDVFKPNDKLSSMLDDAMDRLRRGERLSSCFDRVFNTSNGMARVMLGGKWNVLTDRKEPLSDTWFDYMSSSRIGYFCVELKGKGFNFMDSNGDMVSEMWFDNAQPFFDNGLAKVKLRDYGWNLMTTDGRLFFGKDRWFDEIGNYYYGFARVVENTEEGVNKVQRHKENFIDENGRILGKNWFDEVYDFRANGMARVKKDGLWNFIKSDGNLVSDQWFQKLYSSQSKVVYCGAMTADGRYYTIGMDGKVYH